jgi:hypothetical protein
LSSEVLPLPTLSKVFFAAVRYARQKVASSYLQAAPIIGSTAGLLSVLGRGIVGVKRIQLIDEAGGIYVISIYEITRFARSSRRRHICTFSTSIWYVDVFELVLQVCAITSM